MDPDALAIATATVVALVLLVLYAAASLRERRRGQHPHWAEEVYLYHDSAAASAANGAASAAASAAANGAAIATVGQVEVYLRAGGSAPSRGYAASARGADGGALALVPAAAPPGPAGVWLYGAKPRRGTVGVAPFGCSGDAALPGCARWFQPA